MDSEGKTNVVPARGAGTRKLGPAGSTVPGTDFSIQPQAQSPHSRIKSLQIQGGWAIDKIQVQYENPLTHPPDVYDSPAFGGIGGDANRFDLENDDYLVSVSGTWGAQAPGYPNEEIITLQFHTHQGKQSQVFGGGNSQKQVEPFLFTAPADYAIVGFFGACGSHQNCLVRLGVYVQPAVPHESRAARAVLVFDGQDDYLEIPNSEAINFSQNQDFAIELWLKVGAISTEPKPVFLGDVNVIEKWQGKGFPYAIRYSAMQGTIYAARYDGNNPSLTWPIPLNDQKFHYIAFVKQGVQLFFYVDGTLQGKTEDKTTQTTQNDSPLYLAAGTSITKGAGKRQFFAGQLTEVRLWNTARTQAEIQANLSRRLSGNEPGLVGYWAGDEGVGGTIHDKTSQGNHGTIHGATWATTTDLTFGATQATPTTDNLSKTTDSTIHRTIDAQSSSRTELAADTSPSTTDVSKVDVVGEVLSRATSIVESSTSEKSNLPKNEAKNSTSKKSNLPKNEAKNSTSKKSNLPKNDAAGNFTSATANQTDVQTSSAAYVGDTTPSTTEPTKADTSYLSNTTIERVDVQGSRVTNLEDDSTRFIKEATGTEMSVVDSLYLQNATVNQFHVQGSRVTNVGDTTPSTKETNKVDVVGAVTSSAASIRESSTSEKLNILKNDITGNFTSAAINQGDVQVSNAAKVEDVIRRTTQETSKFNAFGKSNPSAFNSVGSAVRWIFNFIADIAKEAFSRIDRSVCIILQQQNRYPKKYILLSVFTTVGTIAAVSALSLLMFTSVQSAQAESLLQNGRIDTVQNTSSNQDNFAVAVSEGTGPCNNKIIIFPVLGTKKAGTYQRAYLTALTALSSSSRVDIYSSSGYSCDHGDQINIRKPEPTMPSSVKAKAEGQKSISSGQESKSTKQKEHFNLDFDAAGRRPLPRFYPDSNFDSEKFFGSPLPYQPPGLGFKQQRYGGWQEFPPDAARQGGFADDLPQPPWRSRPSCDWRRP